MKSIDQPGGHLLIQGYGDEGFRIGGSLFKESVVLLPDQVVPWPIGALAEVVPESLGAVMERAADIDLLLLGSGKNGAPPPPALREALKATGVALEVMDTGAACRTYNVLVSEDRLVAAALIRPSP